MADPFHPPTPDAYHQNIAWDFLLGRWRSGGVIYVADDPYYSDFTETGWLADWKINPALATWIESPTPAQAAAQGVNLDLLGSAGYAGPIPSGVLASTQLPPGVPGQSPDTPARAIAGDPTVPILSLNEALYAAGAGVAGFILSGGNPVVAAAAAGGWYVLSQRS